MASLAQLSRIHLITSLKPLTKILKRYIIFEILWVFKKFVFLCNCIIHFMWTQDIEQGICNGESTVPTEEAIDFLTKAYQSSPNYEQVRSQIAEICRQVSNTMEKKKNKNKNHASFTTQCEVLMRRSFLNMYRDLGYYWLRLAVYVALALSLATVFHHLDYSPRSIDVSIQIKYTKLSIKCIDDL